ncbi:extracellular solute-binding protein [Verticiella sediminum]|uniref:Extracellular solute-binding protein n=1 Tax=Verticiella sediminum TaxID=1247510 RepID=A0A556ARK4_9BURK|nr:extracellular solute-binding protein [Verticiella sediminum]TSH95035.1 extracellular solute-binding protein [Verticiella sediminum]
MSITRRQFTATVGAALMLPALRVSAAEPDEAYLKELHDAARKEGELTWYVAHLTSELAEQVGQMFTARYPGVRVNVVRTTAQVAYQRLSQDLRANIANCDVFASTDIGHFLDLKDRGLLMQYVPRSHKTFDERFQNYDPDGYYSVTSSNLISLLYNPTKLKAEDVGTSWQALTDPKFKGRVSVGHPGFSGFVGTWLVAMTELYGEAFIDALAKNQPQVGRSIIDTVTTLISGERQVSAGPVSLALTQKARGNPVDVIYADEGAVLMVLPSAIMANARHPNAAKLFMEWSGSKEYASISVDEYNTPLRPDVPPREGVKSISEIKTIQPSNESVRTKVPELIEEWRDTFGV